MPTPPRRAVPAWHRWHPRLAPLLAAALVAPSLAAALLAAPQAALAAPATTTTDLNLRSGPGMDSPVILVMPPGAALEVNGPPQAGFAPVTYAGTDGWAAVDFLSTGGAAPASPAAPSGDGGTATTTSDLNLRAGPSTGDPVLLVIPPGAAVTLTGQSANGFAGVVYNGTAGWAFAAYLGGGGAPAPDPGPAPAPSPQPGPTGSARTTTELNLRAGPSTGDAVLAVMPAGATVALTGSTSNGFAAVDYNGTAGWAFAAYLGDAAAPAPPPAVAPSPDPGPAPSGGTAATTTALNLREGPSTSARILTVMPAGASVELTGAAENGFQQVVYFGQTGWAFASYLGGAGAAPPPGGNSPPPAAAPAAPAPGGPPPGGSNVSTDEIVQIIYAAADRYGQPREDMLRVARCESNLDPRAVNVSGSSYGLFQFIRSTWASTPYASYDIFDPWANANAAGWMWSVGRRNEWVCQ